jgi:hypothetical protein
MQALCPHNGICTNLLCVYLGLAHILFHFTFNSFLPRFLNMGAALPSSRRMHISFLLNHNAVSHTTTPSTLDATSTQDTLPNGLSGQASHPTTSSTLSATSEAQNDPSSMPMLSPRLCSVCGIDKSITRSKWKRKGDEWHCRCCFAYASRHSGAARPRYLWRMPAFNPSHKARCGIEGCKEVFTGLGRVHLVRKHWREKHPQAESTAKVIYCYDDRCASPFHGSSQLANWNQHMSSKHPGILYPGLTCEICKWKATAQGKLGLMASMYRHIERHIKAGLLTTG